MITETIQYVNHDKVPKTAVLHFHISEAVLTENFIMFEKVQDFMKVIDGLQGEERELTNEETQDLIDIVKWFMRISYGVKTPEGDFDQDEPAGSGEVWHKFRISNAYSTFLMSLFRPNPMKLVDFIAGVIPEEILAQLETSDDPRIKQAIADAEKRRQAIDRLPVGTRIVDDVPIAPGADSAPLRVVPEPVDESAPDYDSMLAEVVAETAERGLEKRPITQHQHDVMKSKLKPEQFEDFMSTRYVADPAE